MTKLMDEILKLSFLIALKYAYYELYFLHFKTKPFACPHCRVPDELGCIS
jgi:hypothetical protein